MPNLLRQLGYNVMSNSNYIMISGTGRSGTNIIKDILNLNSSVYALPFEHRITIDPDGIIDFYLSSLNIWSPYMYDKKLKNLKSF